MKKINKKYACFNSRIVRILGCIFFLILTIVLVWKQCMIAVATPFLAFVCIESLIKIRWIRIGVKIIVLSLFVLISCYIWRDFIQQIEVSKTEFLKMK